MLATAQSVQDEITAVFALVVASAAVIALVVKIVKFFIDISALLRHNTEATVEAKEAAQEARTAVTLNGGTTMADDVARLVERMAAFEEGQRLGGELIRNIDRKIDEARERMSVVEHRLEKVETGVQEGFQKVEELASKDPPTGEVPITRES